jgi:DNA-binding MarR family transcriptional regulator
VATTTVSGVPWLDEVEQSVWRRLLCVQSRLFARLDADLLGQHHMSLGDYEVLVHLSEAPGRRLRMTELASRLALSPSGVTRRLDGLVAEGLVARRACPSDRRGSLAELTGQGARRLQEAACTHVAGVRRYLLEPLGGHGVEALGEGLRAVAEALGES